MINLNFKRAKINSPSFSFDFKNLFDVIIYSNIRKILKLNKIFFLFLFLLFFALNLTIALFEYIPLMLEKQSILSKKHSELNEAKDILEVKNIKLQKLETKFQALSKPSIDSLYANQQKDVLHKMIKEFNDISKNVTTVKLLEFNDDKKSNSFLCTFLVDSITPAFDIFAIIYFKSLGLIESYDDKKLKIRIIQNV